MLLLFAVRAALAQPAPAEARQDAGLLLRIAKAAFSTDMKARDTAFQQLQQTNNPRAYLVLRELLFDEAMPPADRDLVYLRSSQMAMEALAEMIPNPPVAPLSPEDYTVRRNRWLRYFEEHPELTAVNIDWTPLLTQAIAEGDEAGVRAIGRLWTPAGIPAVTAGKQHAGANSATGRALRAVLARLGSTEDFQAITRELQTSGDVVRRQAAARDLSYIKSRGALSCVCGAYSALPLRDPGGAAGRETAAMRQFLITALNDWTPVALDGDPPGDLANPKLRTWCEQQK